MFEYSLYLLAGITARVQDPRLNLDLRTSTHAYLEANLYAGLIIDSIHGSLAQAVRFAFANKFSFHGRCIVSDPRSPILKMLDCYAAHLDVQHQTGALIALHLAGWTDITADDIKMLLVSVCTPGPRVKLG